jgi:hypothetical protein
MVTNALSELLQVMIKCNQLVTKYRPIYIFENLLAADAHLADGQHLFEKAAVNRGKSLTFWIGNRTPTVTSKEGHNLKP